MFIDGWNLVIFLDSYCDVICHDNAYHVKLGYSIQVKVLTDRG